MCESSKRYLLLIIPIIVIFLSSCSSSSKTEETPPLIDPVPNMETQTVSETLPDLDLPMTPEQIYEYASAATVEITAIGDDFISTGTGFFCDSDAYLITNYHVIEGAREAYITISDGGRYDITGYLGYDEALDIALLETTYSPKTILKSCSETICTGEAVYTIGSSEGLTASFSSGIVSKSSRELNGHSFIQITAQISHGNSGGPVLNSAGDVIGISTATIESGQNLNFAIPIHEISRVSTDSSQSRVDLVTVSHYHEAYKLLRDYIINYGEIVDTEQYGVCYFYEFIDPFFEYLVDLVASADTIGVLWEPYNGNGELVSLVLYKTDEQVFLRVCVEQEDVMYEGKMLCFPCDISISSPPRSYEFEMNNQDGDNDFWMQYAISEKMCLYVGYMFDGLSEVLEYIGFPYELSYFDFEE
ncbi:MAG: S1C family serine protease [Clostridiales bacterium]|nr:S1C family serine protease [Clostridiales bacterium]